MDANRDGATAERIASLLDPQGQPEEKKEPLKAQPEQPPQAIEEEEPQEIEAQEDEQPAETEEVEATADTNLEEEPWQLPNSLSDLADQLELEVDDLLNLGLTEKVNGEERTVKLKDLQQSHMMEADYRQKTAAVAEQKRALEAQVAEQQQMWNDRLMQVDSMTQSLEQQLMADFNGLDWNALRAEDPGEYAARQTDYQQRVTQIQQIKQNAAQEHHYQQQQAAVKNDEYLQKQHELLVEKLPEWGTPQGRQEFTSKITTYMKGQSFTDQELSALSDHRQLLLVNKAMLYDEIQSAKPGIKKRVMKAPKILKPGAKQSKADAKSQQRGQLRTRLKRSGSVKDAARALENFM